jgi:hypothetical protein
MLLSAAVTLLALVFEPIVSVCQGWTCWTFGKRLEAKLGTMVYYRKFSYNPLSFKNQG